MRLDFVRGERVAEFDLFLGESHRELFEFKPGAVPVLAHPEVVYAHRGGGAPVSRVPAVGQPMGEKPVGEDPLLVAFGPRPLAPENRCPWWSRLWGAFDQTLLIGR